MSWPSAIEELAGLDRWVCWREEVRNGKPTKPPLQPTGRYADSTRPETWSTYAAASQAAPDLGDHAGVGCVVGDPYVAIDLDHCRAPETGLIETWAMEIIAGVHSYTEISPSGTGVHIWCRAALPVDGSRKGGYGPAGDGALEIYRARRYMTVTGDHLDGTPDTIEDRTRVIEQWYREVFPSPQNGAHKNGSAGATIAGDEELLDRAMSARNGDRFLALWNNTATEHPSASEGDLALCQMLAFWTGRDAARMDRLFRQSERIRDKWDGRRGATTYGAQTIAKAIEQCSEAHGERESNMNGGGRGEGGERAEHVSVEDTARGVAPPESAWPTMAPEAFYGPAGRIVEAVAPKSEADPVAILVHVLVAAGNLVGSGPHATVEQDWHPARLNAVLVGKSSKGRKGTGWSSPRAILRAADPGWSVASGLSSGEGLIFHVRDRVERLDPQSGEPEVVDEGVGDKRLLVMETEFASVLARMSREGNTLSAVLRDAWDHGDLRTLTKNSPLRATGAHVSVLGHITEEELARLLTDVSMANGFGNRMLWIRVRRAQLLPDGGGVDPAILASLTDALTAAVSAAGRLGRMGRDPETADVWRAVYPELSRERDGLVGALLGRAEAQTLRLSVAYAALDGSPVIRLPHLHAALAVWGYAEGSVLGLFAGRLGHPVADAILAALRQAPYLTRTNIRDLFSRHRGSVEIEEALAMLERAGLAKRRTRQTGGRPEEFWEASA